MSFSSDEVNFLVYRYLQESGKDNMLGWKAACQLNDHLEKFI